MLKYEYKMIVRQCGWEKREYEKDSAIYRNTEWETRIDGEYIKGADIEKYVNELGDQGWDLVSVIAESLINGGVSQISGSTGFGGEGRIGGWTTDYAGFTNYEKWVFKRPKQ